MHRYSIADYMTDAQKLIEEGEILLNEFDHEGAYKKFKKAVKESNDARAFFGKAEAALGIPSIDSEEIIGDYKKAIELDENPFYHQALAEFCIEVGKFDTAEEHYRHASDLDPENRAGYMADMAVGYRFKAPIMMEKFLAQGGEEIILRKSLMYMLEALEIDRETLKELMC